MHLTNRLCPTSPLGVAAAFTRVRPCSAAYGSTQVPRRRSRVTMPSSSEPCRPKGEALNSPPAADKQHQQQQEQQFQQVLEEVQQQSYSDLQQLVEEQPQHRAFSASFLFWLSAKEKRALGEQKQDLALLAAQLVQLKEQAEFHASRRMLPPLASSLAYSNYSQWRVSHSDQDLPDVTPGVSLTDLYKAGEREEARLKQWQSPQRPSSTLDDFAAASGYGSFAADAMARVRARLAGYEDDDSLQQQQQQQQQQQPGASEEQQGGAAAAAPQQQQQQGVSPAATRVLDELLLGCCCREERATLLPEACMPPGLEVSATGSSQSKGATARVLTSPARLLAAVAARVEEAAAGEDEVLPSGEGLRQALQELREDIAEYDQHVYSRLQGRDRLL